ncbi:MAG: hypothetical protein LBF02_02440 [Mycoplasmataceae bacterium]|nr:hypothetical protein [Mycoplasmataceae bacterium]
MFQYYQIHELTNHSFNLNQYVYFDSFETITEIKNNKWCFNTNFYIVYDGILPQDSFLCDIETPFVSIKDLQILQIPHSYIPFWVKEKQLCHLYNASFSIPITSSEFVTNEINNLIFDINMKLSLNQHTSYDNIDKNILKVMSNEIVKKNLCSALVYSNTENIKDKSGFIQENNKFYLNSNGASFSLGQKINIKTLNENIDNQLIKDLWTINFEEQTYIQEISNNITIELFKKNSQQIIKENVLINSMLDKLNIGIINNYIYNPVLKTIEKNNLGQNGINILEEGKITILSTIKYLDYFNSPRFIKLTSVYNFKNSLIEQTPKVKSIVFNIDDLKSNLFIEKIYE